MKINGRKVLKARGGMDASKADFKTPSSSPLSAGYSGAKSAVSTGRVDSPGGGNQKNTLGTTLKNSATKIAKSTGQLSTLPVTPFGLAVTTMTALENARRAKRAKGEFPFSKKTVLPVTRDFYRTNKRPLDYKIGGKDEDYLKATGITGGVKPPPPDFEDNKQLCPDGTRPPCKTPATQIKNPVSTPNPFFKGFQSYDDGGEVVISSNVDKDLL